MARRVSLAGGCPVDAVGPSRRRPLQHHASWHPRRVASGNPAANGEVLAASAPCQRPPSPETRSGDNATLVVTKLVWWSNTAAVRERHAEASTRRIGRNPQTEPHSARNGGDSKALERLKYRGSNTYARCDFRRMVPRHRAPNLRRSGTGRQALRPISVPTKRASR
jgi:hypothetical protein